MKRPGLTLIAVALAATTSSVFAGGFQYRPMGSSDGDLGLRMEQYGEASGKRTHVYGNGFYKFGQKINGPHVLPGSHIGSDGGYGYESAGRGHSNGGGAAGFRGKWSQKQWSFGGKKQMRDGSDGDLGLRMEQYGEASGKRTHVYGNGFYKFGQKINGPHVLPGSHIGSDGGYGYESAGRGHSNGGGAAGFRGKWSQKQWSFGGSHHR